MSERQVALNQLEDRVHELRRVYDSSLEEIATIGLQTQALRERPVFEPIEGQGTDSVRVIYGFRRVDTGPTRTRPDTLQTDSIVFRRNDTRTIDIWNVEQLEQALPGEVYARTPLLFHRGDNLNVDFVPRQVDEQAIGPEHWVRPVARGDLGNEDGIMLLGRVCEALGARITGDTPVLRTIQRAFRKKVEPTPDQVALKLFMSYLPKEEKQRWQKFGCVLVPSKIHPAFNYEITHNAVYLINEKLERTYHFCVIAADSEPVPQADVTLSKYLLLQANEVKFLQIANRSHASGPSNLLRGRWVSPEQQNQNLRARLEARRDSVDLTTLGLQGGTYAGFTPIDLRALEDAVTNYQVAQAMLDGIANSPDGLAVRDILPDRDLNYRRRADR